LDRAVENNRLGDLANYHDDVLEGALKLRGDDLAEANRMAMAAYLNYSDEV
jgi:hypothetical protein